MPRRNITITVITLFCIVTIAFTFMYGPAKRIFIEPSKIVSVRSALELDTIWRSTGVHGRIAVIFVRHLNPQLSGAGFPETDYLDNAMRQGIVRTTYVIIPDSAWPEVVTEYLSNPSLIVPLKTTDTGFMLLHEGGRIHVRPLSKYVPSSGKEQALIVIEQGIWTRLESKKIDDYLRSGLQAADLVVSVETK